MYRLGEVEHSHRKLYALLASFIVVIGLAAVITSFFLRPNTHISTPPAPVITHVSYDTTKLTTFNEPLFSISLPDDFKAAKHGSDIPAPSYSWQGTVKDNANRWLSVYVDEDVAKLAVNRELYVQANGQSVEVLSDVSDNCTTFTGSTSTAQGVSSTPAKWQGIDFLCDSGNYERDVVGVASPDGLNTVALTASSGHHHFFFTYTDNSISPDYSIFTNALKSFRLKP